MCHFIQVNHHSFVSLIQELEGDEEGEDEDDADVNPKVSYLGTSRAYQYCTVGLLKLFPL